MDTTISVNILFISISIFFILITVGFAVLLAFVIVIFKKISKFLETANKEAEKFMADIDGVRVKIYKFLSFFKKKSKE